MNILVINCGSSSIKARVVDSADGKCLAGMRVERLADDDQASLLTIDGHQQACPVDSHDEALTIALPMLLDRLPEGGVELAGVGHRVVHGGRHFDRPVVIDDDIERVIDELSPLAPLHNPANLAGIRSARALLPGLTHVAVFDTAFHRTLPRRARSYAIPPAVAEAYSIERYGFHGSSHQYVAGKAAAFFGADVRELRLVTCHLGNGCSVAAVEYGRSIETSMGMTPLEGLVMGTRSGDIDPGALIHLMRQEGWDADRIDALLNHESGLAGLSGVGNDLRDIEAGAAEGDERCRLAIQVSAHRVRKYIGAYAAVMGGVDAIVFTAGIGENSALMRHRIAQRLDFLGARIDEDRNRHLSVDHDQPVASFSIQPSRCELLVVATDEEHSIAEQSAHVIREHDRPASAGGRTIPIAISARHVHLTRETVEKLFGKGHKLTPRNPLSQPGQFASEETVTLVGPNNELEHVRVLGPTRETNQVEISRTDEFCLGIDAPVRGSGDIDNTPGITLRGPAGEVTLDKGVICALRHIHMSPEDARDFGVEDGDMVEVDVSCGPRDLTFGDVLIRVSPNYRLEMHIDTDEGNAAHLGRNAEGALISTEGRAAIQLRSTRYDVSAESKEKE